MYMTFVCKINNTVITYETESVALETILDGFKDFLKGAGFVVNGELQFVNEQSAERRRGEI